jgi:Rrf2 family protein
VKYLEQIVGVLSKAGFLHSIRGPQGGYRLTRPADGYTVGDILRLTEGNLAPVRVSGGRREPLSAVRRLRHAGFLDGAVRHH